MFDFITLSDYPVQTIVHWIQGFLVGFLVVQAHYTRAWHLTGYALISTLCFICYEWTEQQSINDRAFIDIANFTLMLHLSAGITFLFHYLKQKRLENKPKKGYN